MSDDTVEMATTGPLPEVATITENPPAPVETPVPSSGDGAAGNVAGTLSPSLASDADAVKTDAERDVHHGLSHLEAEAIEYFVTLPVEKVKELLAWVASKL